LILDHLPDLRIGKETTDLLLVVALDDEGFVEFGVAHSDVLHPQYFAQIAEETLPIDREPEALGINVGSTDAC
jgi:hypothetical protein